MRSGTRAAGNKLGRQFANVVNSRTMHPYLLRLGASHHSAIGRLGHHRRHAHAVDVVGEEALDVLVLGGLDVMAEVALDSFLVDGGAEGEEGGRLEGVRKLHGCRDGVVAEVPEM